MDENPKNYRDLSQYVSGLDDASLARQIQKDAIDVLADLSGHTAGSRLTMFAHRPAPVQVSWLGYFATTGLDTIDAVLLDDVHAPPGTESQFVEKIIRLPHTRWCDRPPFSIFWWVGELRGALDGCAGGDMAAEPRSEPPDSFLFISHWPERADRQGR
jgi:hypothetical protein